MNPSGDHAQYVMVGDKGAGCAGSNATSSLLTFSLGSTATLNSGNFAPTDDISGTKPALDGPYAGNVDDNSFEWVANGNAPSVTAYKVNATGTPAPSYEISGSNTTLVDPSGVVVTQTSSGVNNYIYVTDYLSNAIDVYKPPTSSTNDNEAPLYQIKGGATTLSEPWGITVDASGNLWVANGLGGDVLEFAPSPGSTGAVNEAPTLTLGGGATTLSFPADVYIDSKSDVWVADDHTNTIDEFAPGATTSAPIARLTVSGTPTGVAVDSGGNVYATGYSAAIWIWPASSIAATVSSPPLSITGPSTKLACATGVRVFTTSGTNDV